MTEDELDPPGVQLEIFDALADSEHAEAIRLVVGTQFGSASMLQRQLGISRARAAEIMLFLEERGVVGPSPNVGHARDVLVRAEHLTDTLHALTGAPQS